MPEIFLPVLPGSFNSFYKVSWKPAISPIEKRLSKRICTIILFWTERCNTQRKEISIFTDKINFQER